MWHFNFLGWESSKMAFSTMWGKQKEKMVSSGIWFRLYFIIGCFVLCYYPYQLLSGIFYGLTLRVLGRIVEYVRDFWATSGLTIHKVHSPRQTYALLWFIVELKMVGRFVLDPIVFLIMALYFLSSIGYKQNVID